MFSRVAQRLTRAFSADAPATTRVARNVVAILVGDAAAEAVNTVSTARSALALGPGGFGVLSAAQAFVEPFRALAAFGLSVVCMTVAARRGGADGTLVRTLGGLHAFFALVATGVVLALSAATGAGGPLPLLSVVTLSMLPVVMTVAVRVPAQYEQAMHRLVVLPLGVSLVRLALIETAVRTGNTPFWHQSAITVSAVAGLAGTWWAVHRVYGLDGRWNRGLAMELLRTAWPIAVLDIVVTVYLKAAYLFLRPQGAVVLGTYAAAERLAQPLLGLCAAIVSSSLPLVARAAAHRDRHELAVAYRRTIRGATLFVLPTVAAAAVGAPWVLSRFAPEYARAARPLQILLAGVLFMFLNQLSSMFIIGVGRYRTLMIVAIGNLGMYVALASWLVPRYGAVGSALATTVMEGVNCVVQVVIVGVLLGSPRATGPASLDAAAGDSPSTEPPRT